MGRIEAWECPECGHMVPKKVTVCRCGHQWTGAERPGTLGTDPSTGQAPAEMQAAPTTPRGGSWLSLAVVALVIGGGAFVFLHRQPASPASVATAEPPVHEPAAPAAAAPQPSAPASWPADSSLWKEAPPSRGPAPSAAPATAAPARTLSLEDVVNEALPAVVLVKTTEASGTGFFVSSDTVITNAHVVDGATYVTVRSASGEEIPAVVTVRANEVDLAELHVSKARPGQAVLALGDSSHLRVGEEIVAIGSPMGLQNTVTRGIVSSLRRLGAVTLVQTDAAINHGNSGGPLVDHTGHVIAVATMKATGDVQSIGFGVAAEHVRALLDGNAPASSSARRPVDMLNAGSSAGQADTEHDEAVAGYERFISDAAKRADQIDRSWGDLVAQCMSGRTPEARGERAWFLLWEGFDDARIAQGCGNYYSEFKGAVQSFQRHMTEGIDLARRGGVYPGEARDIRHQYHLDSPDW